jgi:hypothetical protein
MAKNVEKNQTDVKGKGVNKGSGKTQGEGPARKGQ